MYGIKDEINNFHSLSYKRFCGEGNGDLPCQNKRQHVVCVLSASKNEGLCDLSLYIENVKQIFVLSQPITDFPTYI